MARLAFFSPLPPAPTGIADYTIDVLRALQERHAIDVFHDQDAIEEAGLPANVGAYRAHDFEGRQGARPYDAIVYQMGNGMAHAYMYPFLARRPGLLVLHDLVLHHSRARMFLDSPEARAYAADPSRADLREAALARIGEYRDELEATYPGRGQRIADAQLGTIGQLLPYAYPMFEGPAGTAHVVACHNDFMAEAVRAALPERPVVRIPMIATPTPVEASAVAALRARLGLDPEALVVASFGLLTPEKRIETVARAVARAATVLPHLRLLLVGPVPERAALDSTLRHLDVAARTVITGRIAFEELPAHIEAADVVVHLRYPTARETSAALLRVLAQGRPTVISDLEHLADIPDDAVVRASVDDEEGEVFRALLRLADDEGRRRRLGASAAAFVAMSHTAEGCARAYDDAIARTLERSRAALQL